MQTLPGASGHAWRGASDPCHPIGRGVATAGTPGQAMTRRARAGSGFGYER